MAVKTCLAVLVIFKNSESLENTIKNIPKDCGLVVVHNDQPYQEDYTVTDIGGREVTNIYNGNRGMLAGAYNRVIFDKKITEDFSHIILLDQDSDFSKMSKFIREYFGNLALDHGRTICAPLYIDRSTKRQVRIVRLRRLGFKIVSQNTNPGRYISSSCIINSMAVIPIKLAHNIGGWDERIGLDHIDTDFCLKALTNQSVLIYDTNSFFLHSIGDRKIVNLFGLTIQSTFHSDFRVGLIFKNSGILFRRYFFTKYLLNFIPLLIVRMLYDLLGIVLVEKSPSKFFLSCKMFIKGVFR
jgi:rhamnosyltransferase